MKIERNPGVTVKNTTSATVLGRKADQLQKLPYFNFLQAIGEMYQTIEQGSDAYMIVGTTKDRSATCITVFLNGARDSVYGPTFEEAAVACQKWLETR